MIFFITFISLLGLIIFHELGHFILAKRFGVKVEEFGIGLPPRIFGKKIGETIYSLNLLPFGAFVRLYGEEKEIKDVQSFSGKPIWQRSLIILGGVISFWIISVILLTVVIGLGAPAVISDEEQENLVDPKVQIMAVASNSPAEIAGIKPGDTIRKFSISNSQFSINKVKEIQELIEKYKGKEVILTIERGKEIFEISLVPRISPPKGEGAMGVVLKKTAIKFYPWYEVPIQAILTTANLTITIIKGWIGVLGNVLQGIPTPGVQLMGPIGIFSLSTQISQLGIVYFLHFIAIISIHLALFNILPIPIFDGGKLLFLGFEKLTGKNIDQKKEQNINLFFFILLIFLMIWVTIKDIARLF